MKRIPVSIPDDLKVKLENMSNEVGISQNNLMVMAIQSLMVNYEEKGSFIFVDLLNPDHRSKK